MRLLRGVDGLVILALADITINKKKDQRMKNSSQPLSSAQITLMFVLSQKIATEVFQWVLIKIKKYQFQPTIFAHKNLTGEI